MGTFSNDSTEDLYVSVCYPDSINQSKIDTTEIISLYNALLKFTLAFVYLL